MTGKKRQQFKCWNCEEEFGLTKDYRNIHAKLTLECPYCEAVCVVDLAPFRTGIDTTARSTGPSIGDGLQSLTLPDVLPTSEVPDEDILDEED